MSNHTEKSNLKKVAVRRAIILSKDFDYVVVIKDRLRNYWVHTVEQDLCGDKLIMEIKKGDIDHGKR